MIRIGGGTFVMGSDRHYPEERPARPAAVQPFTLSATPVTVAEFAGFVAATGYLTSAECPPPETGGPAGSAVFTPPDHPVDLSDPAGWWSWVEGAHWRCPSGPGSSAVADHPVVHVALADALAYCAWASARLPTEVEWESAAQGASPASAQVFEGVFPHAPTRPATTSAVRSRPASPLGLHDLLGNVWEWTATPWTPDHAAGCCAPSGTGGGHVVKGGSFLCSADYCARYRPSARMAMEVGATTCHLGFRTAGQVAPAVTP